MNKRRIRDCLKFSINEINDTEYECIEVFFTVMPRHTASAYFGPGGNACAVVCLGEWEGEAESKMLHSVECGYFSEAAAALVKKLKEKILSA